MTCHRKSLLGLVCLILVATSALPTYAAKGLFGSREVRYSSLRSFTKWTNMLSRHQHCLQLTGTPDCSYRDWPQLIESLQDQSLAKKIQTVNRFANQSPYVTDYDNWGMSDYWATPPQFVKKSGDCEDYSIAKYWALSQLGIPKKDMRIVILEDRNLRIMHAVLAVEVAGREYILDNQIKRVIEDKDIYHYKPVYSINERNWWRHYTR